MPKLAKVQPDAALEHALAMLAARESEIERLRKALATAEKRIASLEGATTPPRARSPGARVKQALFLAIDRTVAMWEATQHLYRGIDVAAKERPNGSPLVASITIGGSPAFRKAWFGRQKEAIVSAASVRSFFDIYAPELAGRMAEVSEKALLTACEAWSNPQGVPRRSDVPEKMVAVAAVLKEMGFRGTPGTLKVDWHKLEKSGAPTWRTSEDDRRLGVRRAASSRKG